MILSKIRFWPLALGLLLFVLVSCGSRGEHIGTYVSDAKDSPKQIETTLELKENGVGVWKVGDEEVPFSWDVKNKELRVNTKSGGVIVGNFEKEVIYITLPGLQTMSFKKTQ
jgi:hypothetical protein